MAFVAPTSIVHCVRRLLLLLFPMKPLPVHGKSLVLPTTVPLRVQCTRLSYYSYVQCTYVYTDHIREFITKTTCIQNADSSVRSAKICFFSCFQQPLRRLGRALLLRLLLSPLRLCLCLRLHEEAHHSHSQWNLLLLLLLLLRH